MCTMPSNHMYAMSEPASNCGLRVVEAVVSGADDNPASRECGAVWVGVQLGFVRDEVGMANRFIPK